MKDKEIQKVGSTIPNSFGQQGWICPKCGAVLSPFTSFCPFCAPKETTVTTAGSYTIPSIDVDWTKHQSITVSKENLK